MMKQFFTILFLLSLNFSYGQITADFETIQIDSFLDGSDLNGGFEDGNIFLPNSYSGGFWSGWALSSTTDITTAGFTNQYSASNGSGYDASSNYAVAFGGSNMLKLTDASLGDSILGFYINNNTYAHLAIKDGNDGFGAVKIFGGVTGDDPDYFLLTIKKYLDGNLSTDSIDFYLADYRFEDNSMDYVINEWTYVDLTSLGAVDSLSFSLSSTDNHPMFGMNTPAYFCLDNLVTSNMIVSNNNLAAELNLEIYPNPTTDFLFIKNLENQNELDISIYNMLGQQFNNTTITNNSNQVNVKNLPKGTYVIKVQDGEKQHSQLFVKQ